MIIVSATAMKNQFGEYLKYVQDGGEIMIEKNGHEVARMIPKDSQSKSVVDELCGILKNSDKDYHEILDEVLKEKYELSD